MLFHLANRIAPRIISKISMRYSFIALDLDGTTLNSQHELSAKTESVLRRLSGQGVTICIATGRTTRNITRYVTQLALPQDTLPVICFNGSYGFTYCRTMTSTSSSSSSAAFVQSSTVFGEPLQLELTKVLLEFAERQGCVAQYYNGSTGDVFAVPKTEEHLALLKRYEALVGSPQVLIPSYDVALEKSPPAKILIMTNNADALIAHAKELLPQEELTIIKGSPYPFFVEFLPVGINKGSGLVKLCSHLEVPMSQVVAFGDGDNDSEMLTYAGLGFAVHNAKQLAKDAANEVLEWTNDDDAVAKQLEKMMNNGDFQIQCNN